MFRGGGCRGGLGAGLGGAARGSGGGAAAAPLLVGPPPQVTAAHGHGAGAPAGGASHSQRSPPPSPSLYWPRNPADRECGAGPSLAGLRLHPQSLDGRMRRRQVCVQDTGCARDAAGAVQHRTTLCGIESPFHFFLKGFHCRLFSRHAAMTMWAPRPTASACAFRSHRIAVLRLRKQTSPCS